ncbi:hypothetical protein OD91_1819 [Lutibacter sp. Hel_I_33_5]|uniref:tetratricopeptide repeat protein n=1 Tax=Lutibacter sp. Hel_I_33_5 TaxID=1566289 RepID=UPI00119C95DD|nr:hypothetical protein [Lutibacter sp. Hel_I_33_5]TVZ56532.1 hypothetical protein OD91_1819 [Lutibacter sp. Hel_I_33_5]
MKLFKTPQIKTAILFSILFISYFNIVQHGFSQSTERTVYGKTLYQGSPISDVNILIENTNRIVKSDNKGNYSIEAKIGESIKYSHVSFKTIKILVEDITSELIINLVPKNNKLDEVIIKGKSTSGREGYNNSLNAEKEFSTSRGKFSAKKAGYAVSFVDGKKIGSLYSNIQQALNGKIPGYVYDQVTEKAFMRGVGMSINNVIPVAWEVDGVFTSDPPVALDLDQISNVYALKGLSATNKYGTLGAGGVIVIKTSLGNYNPKAAQEKVAEKYRNQNFYEDDAVSGDVTTLSKYETKLLTFKDKVAAKKYYLEELEDKVDFNIQLGVAEKFIKHFKDPQTGYLIFNNLTEKYQKNPEILKAIAYQMQDLGLKRDAIKLYEKTYRLRPKYAQSVRDLSNAYIDNDQYSKAWRLYMSYVLKGNDTNDEGIGETIYNEMEWMFFNRKNQAGIKRAFIPKNKDVKEFSKDVRLVFEWNTSEAEFDIEFVNPDKRVFKFQHTLTDNQELINKEKTKGFSSKEFYIDELNKGNWLINLQYYGNKKVVPTYFKVTTYYNWSKPNQSQKIKLFKLNNTYDKVQLIKL